MKSCYDNVPEESLADLESSIDGLIGSIRKKLQVDNPALLMACVLQMEDLRNTTSVGDCLVTSPSTDFVHTGEYLQSLLTIQEPTATLRHEDRVDVVASSLLKDLEDLSSLLKRFLFHHAQAQMANDSAFDLFPYEMQLMSSVQGKRYTCFESSYHRLLLPAHDEELEKLFGIGSNELLEGFNKMRHKLTYGKVDDLNSLMGRLDEAMGDNTRELSQPSEDDRNAISELIQRCFTEQRYEIEPLSVWPERFVESLSWELGCARCDTSKRGIWPTNTNQVKMRPFIKIGDKYYCFDYYAFVDNFYRAVQHALITTDPEYKETWQTRQQEASETAVAKVLKRMLPGCKCHMNNHYGTKKNRRENDILIQYKDALLIVEVKAGGFTLDSPLDNIPAHIDRYKSLIEESGDQCSHMLEVLEGTDKLAILDNRGNEKAVVDLGEITTTYALSVTIENVNSVAAQAEKIAFLNMREGVISIALDDLMVYEDYFDNPLVFLHFLKHRTKATGNQRMALNDELDHLGLYIEENCYEQVTDEYPDNAHIVFAGLREELDAYYEAKSTPLELPFKPSQSMPAMMPSLLDALALQSQGHPVYGSSLLLDIADRDGFCKTLEDELYQQRRIGRQRTIVMTVEDGGVPVICFVDQFGILAFKRDIKRERVAIEILGTDYEKGSLLNVRFEEDARVVEAEFELISKELITPERLEEFRERRYRLMMERGLKPGRNDKCPCGSGVKFKRCHGR